jgi:hypothetical protein
MKIRVVSVVFSLVIVVVGGAWFIKGHNARPSPLEEFRFVTVGPSLDTGTTAPGGSFLVGLPGNLTTELPPADDNSH